MSASRIDATALLPRHDRARTLADRGAGGTAEAEVVDLEARLEGLDLFRQLRLAEERLARRELDELEVAPERAPARRQ